MIKGYFMQIFTPTHQLTLKSAEGVNTSDYYSDVLLRFLLPIACAKK